MDLSKIGANQFAEEPLSEEQFAEGQFAEGQFAEDKTAGELGKLMKLGNGRQIIESVQP